MHGLNVKVKANFSITSFSTGPTGPSSGAPGKKSWSKEDHTLQRRH